MNKRQWLDSYADENDLDLLIMDEFDEAIVGICHRFNDSFVLYDRELVIEILTSTMEAPPGEDSCEVDPETMAWEHFGYNIIGGWVGDATPGFVEYPA